MSRHTHTKKAIVERARLTWQNKALLISLPFIVFGGPSLVLHFSSIHNQASSVSRTVDKWRHLYHLTDAQAAAIQQIELDFHGNGSPFSLRKLRSAEAKRRHHEDISRQMLPIDGENFIKMMEAGGEKH
ncbi:MAG: hypothetical protein ACYC67_26255 [Prosthecobacter sp.]|nr:MAG: hypothetical protein B7Z47_00925 [Chthoniobacter sp. 12-60-6]